jgi:hypothetical protein
MISCDEMLGVEFTYSCSLRTGVASQDPSDNSAASNSKHYIFCAMLISLSATLRFAILLVSSLALDR